MKTISIKLVLLFLTIPFISFAQATNDYCGVGDHPDPNPDGVYNQSIDPNYLASINAPVVYNIFFWGINDDDGNSTNELTEAKALGVVARLNIAFNNNNIFKYRGFDIINETDIYIADDIEDILDYAIPNNKYNADAFNMYVPLRFTSSSLTGDAVFVQHSHRCGLIC